MGRRSVVIGNLNDRCGTPPRRCRSVLRPVGRDRSEEQERLMQKKRAVVLALVSAATLVGGGAFAVHAQSTKVISSYGPNNQDMTFDQIKTARLAVKAERARTHAALLASRYELKKATGDARMSGGKAVPILALIHI